MPKYGGSDDFYAGIVVVPYFDPHDFYGKQEPFLESRTLSGELICSQSQRIVV